MQWPERASSTGSPEICPQRVVELSEAVVCRNLFREQSPLLKFGRFEVVRTLGRGATGIVYEAVDSMRHEHVALKVLHRRGPGELYRLKREFRSLGEIQHPNLIKLNELWVDEKDAYFTMDLVLGRNFVMYARSVLAERSDERPYERFLNALAQLCEGLEALHDHGKLHCDIKPSNVLVTDVGRVVLLDFGLVRNADDDEVADGTPGYMAPEALRNEIVPASDWYSVGVMLRESLLGAPPESLPAGMRRGMEELVRSLVSVDPGERAGFAETAAIAFGLSKSTGVRSARAPQRPRFVGRDVELAKLGRAFAWTSRGPAALVVTGESGVGKSALLAELDRAVLRPAGAFVLRGRCSERESVPYNAMDCVVDELGDHLVNVPAEAAPKLDGSEVAALLGLFPVLGRVKWLGECSPADVAAHDSQERIPGVDALKALFRSIAERSPCVLFIDDLQWADEVSGRLLAELLCAEDSPRLLVVAAARIDTEGPGPTLAAFEGRASLLANPIAFEQVELKRRSQAREAGDDRAGPSRLRRAKERLRPAASVPSRAPLPHGPATEPKPPVQPPSAPSRAYRNARPG